ncbi:MAG: ABC transporter ATP-binding protein [Bacteroidetes bacterium]|nr:ABC transporter ATP-binding protein [Bacteroidota bacterium]
MARNSFFLLDTYKKIKNNLPDYVLKSIFKLFPAYLIASLFEIFGLFVLFPVIKVIIEPSIIQENKYIHFLYTKLHFTSSISFVLFLFSSVTLLFVLKNVVIYLISKRQINVSFNMASRLSLEKYNSYLNKQYSFHSNNNTAVLLRNFTHMPFDFIQYLILPFIAIINETFILVLIITAITIFDPLLFWSLVIFIAPFLLIYSKIYKKKLKEISKIRDKESAYLYKLGLQSMEAFREIVVFNKLEYFKPIYKKTVNRFTKSISEAYTINSFSPKFVETVAVLAIFSIFISGYFFNNNLGELAQFLIIFAIAAFRIIPSLNKIILYSNYIKSSFFIFDHFNIADDHEQNGTKGQNNESTEDFQFNHELELKNISFAFENKNERVLKDLNLTIKKGETIGIIGTSGSGKSTLLNILLRLYEEQSGGIYIDGKKIKKSSLAAWYKLVSYVPQNITLLDASITENIAFGIPGNEIDSTLLNKVIQQAQLENFIHQLPEGALTQIGEKGIKISGGQRQRIGIARALYHGGKILIFDEATSSLDTETEEMLTESINNISHQELTIIIVAHRIQTLKYCDVIYKLEKGQICSDFNTIAFN